MKCIFKEVALPSGCGSEALSNKSRGLGHEIFRFPFVILQLRTMAHHPFPEASPSLGFGNALVSLRGR